MTVAVSTDAPILAGNSYTFDKQITLILGGNSSGKSSLLKSIAGTIDKEAWDLNQTLEPNFITINNPDENITYYIAEHNLKSQMSHMSDDLGLHLASMKNSSGKATIIQVIAAIDSGNTIILDEPDQSLDISTINKLALLFFKVSFLQNKKLILVVHSKQLLDYISNFLTERPKLAEEFRAIDIKTGLDTTISTYIKEQLA